MDKDELLKYMPDYYNGVYEMEELLKAQSKGLYQFDEKINRTLLNEFIIQVDEKGISVFEDQAGIKPDPGASLETRRNNVLLRLLPPKPLTKRYLNHLLEIMNLKADVKVDYAKRLALVEAKSSDITADKVNNIKYMLNITLPANMIYDIKINLTQTTVQNELYLDVVNTADSYVITQANTEQAPFENKTEAHLYIGFGTNIQTNTVINYEDQNYKE
ncbi:MAG: putative phage tail protein [Lactobacillus crispatus]